MIVNNSLFKTFTVPMLVKIMTNTIKMRERLYKDLIPIRIIMRIAIKYSSLSTISCGFILRNTLREIFWFICM